jgi:hypothetical protein
LPKSSSSSGGLGRSVRAVGERADVGALVEALLRERAGNPVGRDLEAWLHASPRFRAFVDRHRDKIRRKLRAAVGRDALLDVRAELAVVERLLADRRIDVAYEPHGSGRRGPDFAVTFRTRVTLDLEVTRPRVRPDGVDVRRAIAAKLRQLPPSVPNLVLVDVGAAPARAIDVGAEMRALRQSVDGRDQLVLARLDAAGPRAFYERFLRLGGVVVWSEVLTDAILWVNPSARIALPAAAGSALVAALAAAREEPQ